MMHPVFVGKVLNDRKQRKRKKKIALRSLLSKLYLIGLATSNCTIMIQPRSNSDLMLHNVTKLKVDELISVYQVVICRPMQFFFLILFPWNIIIPSLYHAVYHPTDRIITMNVSPFFFHLTKSKLIQSKKKKRKINFVKSEIKILSKNDFRRQQ